MRVKWLLLFLALSFPCSKTYGLECPKPPEQLSKDWDVQVEGAIARIGPVKGGELKSKTKKVTQDLLSRLPGADRLYLEQMMLSTYCSALRDDKTISEGEKAKRLRDYYETIRKSLSKDTDQQSRSAYRKTTKVSQKLKSSTDKTSPHLDRQIARFGVTLGWQLARYEFIYGSELPEAKALSSSIEQEIDDLLVRDGFPYTVKNVDAQEIMHKVNQYYSTTNIQKHAAILLGIAAMRASLVGASQNNSNNEEMKRLALSAMAEIDTSVINTKNKEKLSKDILETQPKDIASVLDLFYKINP